MRLGLVSIFLNIDKSYRVFINECPSENPCEGRSADSATICHNLFLYVMFFTVSQKALNPLA